MTETHFVQDPFSHRNFTQLPNILIEDVRITPSAFKLYVWYKKICGETGKCYQSLETISTGCGLSIPTILTARALLEDLELIVVLKKKQDDGTVKIYITIENIWKKNNKDKGNEDPNLGNKNSLPDPGRVIKNFNSGGKNSLLAPVKNFNPNNIPFNNIPFNKITLSEPCSSDGDCGKSSNHLVTPRKKKTPSEFDHKAANKLHEIVSSHIKVNSNANLNQWADEFRKMREVDKVTEEDIKKTLKWYKTHIGQEYMPEAFSAMTFREKYKQGKFTAAILRCVNGDVKKYDIGDHNHPLQRIRSEFYTNWNGEGRHPTKDELTKICSKLGIPLGTVKEHQV